MGHQSVHLNCRPTDGRHVVSDVFGRTDTLLAAAPMFAFIPPHIDHLPAGMIVVGDGDDVPEAWAFGAPLL
jgi:hypothetical protein